MYPTRLLENQTVAHGIIPMPHSVNGTAVAGVANTVIDTTSDSAVSSMGSERVPSISDGDWIDTNATDSNGTAAGATAITPSTSAYSMDYSAR